MRTLPINENTLQVKTCHLFEIELAVLIVVSKINTTKFMVNDIDKCFVGMKISHAYETNIGGAIYNYFETRSVTLVEPLLNAITIDSAFTVLNENDVVVETIYETPVLPNTADNMDYLQFYHSALGTYTGKIHITDYDLPIVTEGERPALANSDTHYIGQILYLPLSVFYQGTEFDSKGKSSTIELAITNVNQLIGGLVLTHKGLKQRNVTVKKAYIEDATSEKYSLAVPVTTDSKTTLVSRTDAFFVPDASLNDLFTSYVYVSAASVVTEFEGSTDSASSDNKTVSLQATVRIDSSENIALPNRIYSRLRCPFVYKSWRCRFNSGSVVWDVINDTQTGTLGVKATDMFFLFKEMEKGETAIIKIGSELILIDGFSALNGGETKTNEQVRQLTPAQKAAEIAASHCFYTLNMVTRGYGDTVKSSHTWDEPIDILTCKKTEHDCNMHGHDAYFGSFPAIPKNKNYSE